MMEYSGKTNHECTITVHNVTERDNCTWAVTIEGLPVNFAHSFIRVQGRVIEASSVFEQ
jgi:hypothetical protein